MWPTSFIFSGSWVVGLRKDLLATQRQAFAPGTLKNLKSQWKKFAAFAAFSSLHNLPITMDQLCLYIQFLSRSLKCPKSVRNYVSGLKTLHELLDLPFPPYSSIPVRLTFRGLDRSVAHVPNQAEPITINILSDIGKVLNFQDPLHVVVWCLFLFSNSQNKFDGNRRHFFVRVFVTVNLWP